MQKITEAFVKSVQTDGTYTSADGSGLVLVVRNGKRRTTKRWYHRVHFQGKAHTLPLGKWPVVSAEQAKRKAHKNLSDKYEGNLTIEKQRSYTAPRPACPSFADAFCEFVRMNAPNWKNPNTRKTIETMASSYVMPYIGLHRVDEITTSDLVDVLTTNNLWLEKQATAKVVKQRVSQVMDLCVARGYIQISPAGKALTAALPKQKRKVKHHRALPYAEVAPALCKIAEGTGTAASRLALRFISLTVCRPGESLGAKWDEIDKEAGTWTIPGERMKGGNEHVVPLSTAALDVLRQARMQGDSGYLFPTNKGTRNHTGTMRLLMSEAGLDATPHGFRSSFKDWATDTGEDHLTSEFCLAHVAGDATVRAYRRTSMFEARKGLLQRWADYVTR